MSIILIFWLNKLTNAHARAKPKWKECKRIYFFLVFSQPSLGFKFWRTAKVLFWPSGGTKIQLDYCLRKIIKYKVNVLEFSLTADCRSIWMVDRAVFNLVSKVFRISFALLLLSYALWLVSKNSGATFSTNNKQDQNQSWLTHTRFPALDAGYMYYLWIVIGFCAAWPCCDWS